MVAEAESVESQQGITVDDLWSKILASNARNQMTLSNRRVVVLGKISPHFLFLMIFQATI